jgi:hypothetical protein
MPNPHIVSIARGNSQDLLMPEAGLGKKVVELEQQLQQSWLQVAGLHSRLEQSVGRVGELEGEVSRMKSSIEKLLPQIYALQSRLTHIATSPQVSPPPHHGHMHHHVTSSHVSSSPSHYNFSMGIITTCQAPDYVNMLTAHHHLIHGPSHTSPTHVHTHTPIASFL